MRTWIDPDAPQSSLCMAYLGGEGGCQGIQRRLEGAVDLIANGLEDHPLARGDSLLEEFMMAGQDRWQRVRKAPGQLRAARNVGKQESNGA